MRWRPTCSDRRVYVLDGEVFWGQDRIELLADALKSGRAAVSPAGVGSASGQEPVDRFEAEQPHEHSDIALEILHAIDGGHAVCLAFGAGQSAAAVAQSMPDTENGRYALSPVADGVIRLDTRTGAVSTCNNTGAGWACYAVPDERAALDAEIGRLQADNERLKAELAAREPTVTGKIDEPLPKTDSLKKARAEGRRRRAQDRNSAAERPRHGPQ